LRINRLAGDDVAAEVHWCALVESGACGADLCVGGSNTPDLATFQIYSADEEIPVGIDVQCPERRGIGNINRIHPSESAVSRSSKLSAAEIVAVGAPRLVLEAMPRAIGVVDRKPLFIAAVCRCDIRPCLTAIE
jgi:hypothetical protein